MHLTASFLTTAAAVGSALANNVQTSTSVTTSPYLGGLNLYWGQYGQPDDRLSAYCDAPGVTSVSLSFVTYSPKFGGGYPGTNFAGHCGFEMYFTVPSTGVTTKVLMNCDNMKQDIKYCQSKGVKVLLSVGGQCDTTLTGGKGCPYDVDTEADGNEFGELLHKMYGPYDASWTGPRPFDISATEHIAVDGFDIDLEFKYTDFKPYIKLVEKLRSCGVYYITAAPQCPTGHEWFQMKALIYAVKFDALFIQFFNNPGCQISDTPNYDDWEVVISETSQSKDAKLYLGVLASPAAGWAGYVPPSTVKDLICKVKSKAHFGGISVWDATRGGMNLISGQAFHLAISDALKYGCDAIPSNTASISGAASVSVAASGGLSASASASGALVNTLTVSASGSVNDAASGSASVTVGVTAAASTSISGGVSNSAAASGSPSASGSVAASGSMSDAAAINTYTISVSGAVRGSASAINTISAAASVSASASVAASVSVSSAASGSVADASAANSVIASGSSRASTAASGSASASASATDVCEEDNDGFPSGTASRSSAASGVLGSVTGAATSSPSGTNGFGSANGSGNLTVTPFLTNRSSATATVSASKQAVATGTEAANGTVLPLPTPVGSDDNNSASGSAKGTATGSLSVTGFLSGSPSGQATATGFDSGSGSGSGISASGSASIGTDLPLPTPVDTDTALPTPVGSDNSASGSVKPIATGSGAPGSVADASENTLTASQAMTTSTVFTTSVYTVTSCASTVTNCPVGQLATATIALYTTVCPVSAVSTAAATPLTTQWTTSTAYTTKIYTVTSCAPTITNCPVGQVTTKVVPWYTTICPVTVATSTPSKPSIKVHESSKAAKTTDGNSSQTTPVQGGYENVPEPYGSGPKGNGDVPKPTGPTGGQGENQPSEGVLPTGPKPTTTPVGTADKCTGANCPSNWGNNGGNNGGKDSTTTLKKTLTIPVTAVIKANSTLPATGTGYPNKPTSGFTTSTPVPSKPVQAGAGKAGVFGFAGFAVVAAAFLL